MWIFSLFLMLTLPIGSNEEDIFSFSFSCLGYALLSFGFLGEIIIICFVCDELHVSLSKVVDTLEDMPMANEDQDIIKLIKSLENTEPLSVYGLFKIERSTVTSMISTSITYLIILVQFKISLL